MGTSRRGWPAGPASPRGKGSAGVRKKRWIGVFAGEGRHAAVHLEAELRQEAEDLGPRIKPPHAEGPGGDRQGVLDLGGQGGKFVPEESPGQAFGAHRFRVGQISKRRGVPGMQMEADLGAEVVPPLGQDPAGGGVPGHPVGDQERQGQAEIPGDEGKARQGRHVGHPRGRAGIVAEKQPFFFHVQGDYQFHGGPRRDA